VAVCFIMDFPGATLDQYDQVMERMDLGGELPETAIFHMVGLKGDDLCVVDVWESDDAFHAFGESRSARTPRRSASPSPRSRACPSTGPATRARTTTA
jgi:hypothetical protein